MNQAFHLAKIVFSVGFIIAGTVALWLAPNMALPLFVGGIGWTQIPEQMIYDHRNVTTGD